MTKNDGSNDLVTLMGREEYALRTGLGSMFNEGDDHPLPWEDTKYFNGGRKGTYEGKFLEYSQRQMI